jgi:hypothetical protein
MLDHSGTGAFDSGMPLKPATEEPCSSYMELSAFRARWATSL